METRITVNGVEYRSVDEMPPDVREDYDRMMSMLADRNGDGVPDVLEGGAGTMSTAIDTQDSGMLGSVHKVCEVEINGRKYDRWEDVPPELRELMNRARAQGKPQTMLVEARSSRSIPLSDMGTGHGITLHFTWSTLFAVVSVIALAVAVYLVLR